MLFVLCVMGGRVIPMFTNNAIPAARAVRKPRVERFALGLILALILADSLHVSGLSLALLALCAMVAHLTRLWFWQPWTTLNTPLVWVLLGHTGRKLAAGWAEVTCYSLVAAAALVRVFVPLLFPAFILQSVIISAVMWSTGFGLYALRYWPILSRD